MREITKTEVLKNFKSFTEKIEGNLNIPHKSEIVSGGALKYMTIELEKKIDNIKIKINQTFSYLFSEPEKLSVTTGLTIIVVKPVKFDFYLHFWHREFFERIFALNKLNSGNTDFDKKYSAKSNNLILTNTIFQNKNVQDLFMYNKFLVFNINSDNKEINIILKNMELKNYNAEEIEKLYFILLKINNMIEA